MAIRRFARRAENYALKNIEYLAGIYPQISGPIYQSTNALRNRKLVSPRISISPARRILSSPIHIRNGMLLGRIFARNNYWLVQGGAHDAAIKMESTKPVINGRHVDNSKIRVARIWEKICQPMAVDPRNYVGQFVEKSDANALHDGRVVEGPLEPVLGKVYHKLIDNTDGNEVVDLRVHISGKKIPFMYEKRRPISSRFANSNSSVHLCNPTDYFTKGELNLILNFANLMGLDFGEADVLRDKDGSIWVVDSTNGPAGPPVDASLKDAKKAVELAATAFDETITEMAASPVPC